MVKEKRLAHSVEQEVKSLFVDCLVRDHTETFYNRFVGKLGHYLFESLNIRQVAMYSYRSCKRSFYLQQVIPAIQPAPYKKEVLMGLMDETELMDESNILESLENNREVFGMVLRDEEGILGLLAVQIQRNQQEVIKLLIALKDGLGKLVRKALVITERTEKERRYQLLQRITMNFHSSMNMQAVLVELTEALQEMYPSFSYFLLMSQDNESGESIGLPVKNLEMNGEDMYAMQAYVSGSVYMEEKADQQSTCLYAPLLGKQGVYGVLQVIAPARFNFPEEDVEFITLIANTAGGALENAHLYGQSKRLIADLRLINETSHRLNSSLRLGEVIDYLSEQIRISVQTEQIGFFIYDRNHQLKMIQGNKLTFDEAANHDYIEMIRKILEQDRKPIYFGNYDGIVPESSPTYRSIMAFPMMVKGELNGFCLMLHEQPYHFTFDKYKLMQSLVHHSSMTFINLILREELEKMVITDYLTGIYSRHYLEQRMRETLEKGGGGVFILIDIDDFKQMNDTYGHQVGDDLLIQVANIITNGIRDEDVGARWGGEELAVFLPGVEKQAGIAVAKRLVEKVNHMTKPAITISCGLSEWIQCTDDTVEQLFKRADDALYAAKRAGKNQIMSKCI